MPAPQRNIDPCSTEAYVDVPWISGPNAAAQTRRSAIRPPKITCGSPRTSPELTAALLAPVGSHK